MYQLNCNLCEEGNQHSYVGETARNLFTRCREHMQNYTSNKAESFIKKHQNDKHHGSEADFSAEVKASYKDCLSRQVSEGVNIRRSNHTLLNSKTEWHQPALWRVRSEIAAD